VVHQMQSPPPAAKAAWRPTKPPVAIFVPWLLVTPQSPANQLACESEPLAAA
jgi:hypothetical protein